MNACLLLAVTLAAGTPASRPAGAWPFFAFCHDTHDAKKRNAAQQAAMLKELGYDGCGHLWLGGLAERLKTLDANGLKLFQVYMQVNVSGKPEAYDAALSAALPLLKGRGTMLALLCGGGRRSDASLDDKAVAVIGHIADLARPHGVKVVLYPHVGNWVEKMEDALRVVGKVDRPNVGVMFNLCHWQKLGDDKLLRALLTAAMPHLLAVSISGTDATGDVRRGKGKWIQPLDSGSFDMLGFLKMLRELGYAGPVGLQCYGLGGDAREHLARSMAAWRKLRARLGEK